MSTVSQERQTVGPELVDASGLAQWAETASRDAQGTLPELVRRLLSHTPGITAISMRAGDGVALSGWDGEANSAGASFLPAGRLRFEIGAGQQPKRKADKDWDNRRSTPNAHELCFVFVTPRRWRDGKAWTEARKAEGIFADVRVLDADDLEGWLQSAPHVHYWISERLGRTPQHAQTLEQWWSRFSRQTRPNLPSSFFLAGRDSARDKLGEYLADGPDVSTIQAKWREDAISFTAAALDSITSLQGTAAPPAIVVTASDSWPRLAASPITTILIPLFENPDVGAALESGHYVVIPAGPDAVVRGTKVIRLDPPHREQARKSLQEAGMPFDQACELSALARRSMPSFVREISRDQRRQRPDWAANADSALVLAPLALAGAWTARDGDWEAVSELAGTDKETIERLLLHWRQSDDPPFIRSGESQWHVVSREEALMALVSQLTTADLARWLQQTPRVLLELNPVLDLQPEQQMLAGIRGIDRDVSGVLRRGLAEGVAALASLEDTPIAGNTSCQEIAGQVVSAILTHAAADDSGRTWRSLSDVLPLLAEAAPAKFLDAALDDLDTASPVLRTMFQDDKSRSWMGSSSPHSGLLWALEVLCWSPEHISLASLALAKLQMIDPGGKLANRPLASLQSILVFWVRHTSAPLTTRLTVIETICQHVPEVGWPLVLGLWPSMHASAMPPASPRYRDWQPDSRDVPIAEAIEFIGHLVTLAISLARADISRWKDLVQAIAPLPPDQRIVLLDALESLASSGSATGHVQLELWEALRAEVDRHRRFTDADWAMNEATVDRLERVADLVKPTTSTERFAYIFDWHVDLPEEGDHLDPRTREERLVRLRNDAVRETLATDSMADLEALARRVKVPGQLGWAIGDTAPDSMEPALVGWLESDEPNLRNAALAWLRCKLANPDGGLDWFRRMIGTEAMASEDRRLDLMLSTPHRCDFWDLMIAIDPAIADLYWSHCRPIRVSSADTARAVDELLSRGRPWVAVDLIAAELHHSDGETSTLKVEDASRTLDMAITTPPPEHPGQSIGYEVGVVLDYLERHGFDELALARYEFALFPLIEHHRQPRALFKALGSDYKSYVDLVSRVFRGKDEPKRQIDESDVALAHHAYWVLMHWNGLPGLDDSGAIDSAHLKEWVTEARLLFAENDRADIGDEQIGQVLSNSPQGEDGIWPAEPVREIIETIGSSNIESGIVVGRLNKRGATSRGVFDGGRQERDLAAKYRAWSQTTAPTNRRTSRVLRLIAESYERQARQHDADASINSDTE